MVKLVPGTLADTRTLSSPVLQVTLSRVPSESSLNTMMIEPAVTAVVFTVTDVAAAGKVNDPAGDAPHTAGEAELAQFVVVP